jgi:hypothetical protein
MLDADTKRMIAELNATVAGLSQAIDNSAQRSCLPHFRARA